MKKVIVILVVAGAFCVWLFVRQPPQTAKQNAEPQMSLQPTNAITVPLVSNTLPQPASTTNVFVRPDYIDEDHWNQLMLVRQLALERNQPVEFYAQILDQNEQPIGEAQLTVKLSRNDEKMFATTNFFSRQMGDEVVIIPLNLFSDSNGRIQLTNTNGYSLDVWGLTKQGYQSSYPNGNFGGVSYEPNGRRNPSGDIQMTNAWNPGKGYIFHLQKE